MENKLTRANKLSICLAVFYAVIALVTAFGLDAAYTVFARTNPIAALGALFGFKAIAATPIMWLMLIFILVYVVLYDMAFSSRITPDEYTERACQHQYKHDKCYNFFHRLSFLF